MSCKKYVEVTAKFDVDGTVFPLEIQWEDGAKFEIDRILDVRRAASLMIAQRRKDFSFFFQ